MITFILSFAIATAVAFILHGSTRRFVRNRLRYVDAVQKALAPWAAGGAAFLVGALLVPVLPIVVRAPHQWSTAADRCDGRYIQYSYLPVANTYADKAPLVTACTRTMSPSDFVFQNHQL